jgi:hypothetical protein
MSYSGRYQLGDRLPVFLQPKDIDGEVGNPAAPPNVDFYSLDTSAKIRQISIPLLDEGLGVYGGLYLLDSSFPLGRYVAQYRYYLNQYNGVINEYFEIEPGGDPGGAVIGVEGWSRPESYYLVYMNDSGKILQGRNPSTSTSDRVI